MSNLTFVILLPNARREKVRVTQDTSILQILEDCCAKQGFNANEWNLKHYNHIVELGNSVRFSNLPNNATLEMVRLTRPRVESPINLVLILESGKRLIAQFFPHDTLWQVLEHWSSEGEKVFFPERSGSPKTEPICVYMRQEIVGQIKLEEKTLKSLGLYQGSAVIRLVHRPINQVLQGANISGLLPKTSRFSQPRQSQNIPKSTSNKNSSANGSTAITTPINRTQEHLKNRNPVGSNSAKPNEKKSLNHPDAATGASAGTGIGTGVDSQQSQDPSNHLPATSTNKPKPALTATRGSPLPPLANASSSQAQGRSNRNGIQVNEASPPGSLSVAVNQIRQLHAQPGELHILGPHDILVYHGDDVNLPHIESLPDEFYDVTVQDVQEIYRGLQARRRELEEAPLQTRLARNLEHDTNIQRNLVAYPHTIVRIRFPDRFILQGIFKTSDSFRLIYTALRGYLDETVSSNFYLFSTPPRKVLPENTTLIEEGLVGFAIIYFGTDSTQSRYIKPSFPLSDPERVFNFTSSFNQQNASEQQGNGTVTAATRQVVLNSGNPRDSNLGRISNDPASGTSDNRSPGSSAGRPNEKGRGGREGPTANTNVVPKWFKKN